MFGNLFVELHTNSAGMRLRGVGVHGGGAAGVLRGAGGGGAPAVEQALQHLHPLLRAGRRRHGLRPRRRRRHGPPLRLLRAPPLPPLLAVAATARHAAAEPGIRQETLDSGARRRRRPEKAWVMIKFG